MFAFFIKKWINRRYREYTWYVLYYTYPWQRYSLSLISLKPNDFVHMDSQFFFSHMQSVPTFLMYNLTKVYINVLSESSWISGDYNLLHVQPVITLADNGLLYVNLVSQPCVNELWIFDSRCLYSLKSLIQFTNDRSRTCFVKIVQLLFAFVLKYDITLYMLTVNHNRSMKVGTIIAKSDRVCWQTSNRCCSGGDYKYL